jgi:MOSC domain-containing protein YiiM
MKQKKNPNKNPGILRGLAKKESKGGPMVSLTTGIIETLSGLNDDTRGKPGKRQITIVAEESWDVSCEELGQELPWTLRRANLLISGIELKNTTGKLIHINNIILQITGETTPCHVMDKGYNGLQKALIPNWRGGVTCKVIRGGVLSVGDAVNIASGNHDSIENTIV